MDDLKSKISAILSEAENSSSTPTQTKNIKIDNSTKNQGNFIFSFKNQGNHIYLQGSLIIAFLLIALLGFIFFLAKQTAAKTLLRQFPANMNCNTFVWLKFMPLINK